MTTSIDEHVHVFEYGGSGHLASACTAPLPGNRYCGVEIRAHVKDLEARLRKAEEREQALREALENVEKAGHDDDCLFCARKDFNAHRALTQEEPV